MKYFKYADFRINLDNIRGYYPSEKRIKEVNQLRTFGGRLLLWQWGGKIKRLHYITFLEAKDTMVKFPDAESRDRCLLKLDKYIKIHDFKITKL